MITNGEDKISVRSLAEDVYVDELPLNWREYHVNRGDRNINRKSFRIMNREHRINLYPEE